MPLCLCASVVQCLSGSNRLPAYPISSPALKNNRIFPNTPYRLGLPLCPCASVVQCVCGSNRLPASPISDPALKNNRVLSQFPLPARSSSVPLRLCGSVPLWFSASVVQTGCQHPPSAPISDPALKNNRVLSQDPLHNAFKLCDAAGPDPFGDEYIPVAVKTSVMRMHELAIKPHLFVLPHTLGIPHSLDVTPKLR